MNAKKPNGSSSRKEQDKQAQLPQKTLLEIQQEEEHRAMEEKLKKQKEMLDAHCKNTQVFENLLFLHHSALPICKTACVKDLQDFELITNVNMKFFNVFHLNFSFPIIMVNFLVKAI